MKKILTGLLIAMFCVFGVSGTTFAKDVQLQIEWTFDADFEADITEYIVYYEAEGFPGALVEIQRVGNATERVVDTPVIDLAPGKTSNLYVSAMYATGEEVISDPFPWKFTGKPFVIRVNKI